MLHARSPPRAHGGKRAIIACDACKRNKTACSGGERCFGCIRRKIKCTYPEGRGNAVVNKGYLHALEARNKTLEGIVANMKATGEKNIQTGVKQEGLTVESEDMGADQVADGIAKFMLSPSGEHRFLGAGSSTYLSLELRDILALKTDTSPPTPDADQPPEDNLAWPTTSLFTPLPRLPDYDRAHHLFLSQHQYIGTIFSFVPPTTFLASLATLYNPPNPSTLTPTTSLLYARAFLVFAYGQLYSVNRWTCSSGPPGFTFFNQALSLLPDLRTSPCPLLVSVLALVGYFYQNLNQPDAAFLYIGHALRMAISLGLHTEVPASTPMDATTREHRRRIWSSVYSMDRILCVKSGNPLSISDKDISVRAPSPLPSDDDPNAAVTLERYTQLSRILGRISKRIYRRPRARAALEGAVGGIMRELSTWERELPVGMRVDFGDVSKVGRETVSVYLHYHQCIIMTVRPLLLAVVAERLGGGRKGSWKREVSDETVGWVEECVKAARGSVALLGSVAERNLVATYGFMDGEHAFSAALVLAMSDLALRSTTRNAEALENALRIVRNMAQRGDSAKLRSRCKLLESLMQRRGKRNQGVKESPGDDQGLTAAQEAIPVQPGGSGGEPSGETGNQEVSAVDLGYIDGTAAMNDFTDFDWDLGASAGTDASWMGGYEFLEGMPMGGFDEAQGDGGGGMTWDFGTGI